MISYYTRPCRKDAFLPERFRRKENECESHEKKQKKTENQPDYQYYFQPDHFERPDRMHYSAFTELQPAEPEPGSHEQNRGI